MISEYCVGQETSLRSTKCATDGTGDRNASGQPSDARRPQLVTHHGRTSTVGDWAFSVTSE